VAASPPLRPNFVCTNADAPVQRAPALLFLVGTAWRKFRSFWVCACVAAQSRWCRSIASNGRTRWPAAAQAKSASVAIIPKVCAAREIFGRWRARSVICRPGLYTLRPDFTAPESGSGVVMGTRGLPKKSLFAMRKYLHAP
jgi:hypothetical protein